MNKVFSAIKRAPKRFTAVAAVVAAVLIPAISFAYGPERPTFTFEKPATYVTFNSITDNPDVGDERNFVRIRQAGTGTYQKSVALTPGQTYQVMVYYHNNAESALNASGAGIAKGVTARIQMPGTVDANSAATITGFINSTNANPTSVWDSATATSTSAVALRYVQGSAKITSNGAVNGATLPDALFTSGTPLGYDSLNGVLPGCNQYAGYIVYEFTVDKPNFTVQKQVSVDNGKTWSTNAATTPGATILYRVIYTNTGTTEQDNISVRDMLPTGTSYVAGSSLLANAATGGSYKTVSDGAITSGLAIGNYAAGANAYFKFSAKVADNDSLPTCGTNTLTNTARITTSGGYKESTATVTVNKTCTTPPTTTPPTTTPPTTTTTTPPTTPTELPHTGISTGIGAFVGLGSLIASAAYYITSRRALLGR